MVGVEDRAGETAQVAAAAVRAFSTSSVRMCSAIGQPTTRCEKQSITVAKCKNSSSPQGQVGDVFGVLYRRREIAADQILGRYRQVGHGRSVPAA
ncbi:hypothetical protein [Nocardia sp. NPDC003979]